MKKLLFFSLIILWLSISCAPKITSSVHQVNPPTNYKQIIIVYHLDDDLPKGVEVIGEVKIGDAGFSTKCAYDYVLDQAKLEARKAGGDAILITKHRKPDFWSTCHRITADILLINSN